MMSFNTVQKIKAQPGMTHERIKSPMVSVVVITGMNFPAFMEKLNISLTENLFRAMENDTL